MSIHDYETALRLVDKQGITFRALIMAALHEADKDAYKRLREKFPDIAREYWDRRDGVRGFLRGEDNIADKDFAARDVATKPLPIRSYSRRYTWDE